MNWSRGLWRAWVLFSALWIVGVGLHYWWWLQTTTWHFSQPDITRVPKAEFDAIVGQVRWIQQQHVGAAIAAPLAVLVIGAGVLWVVRGFRPED